jgi:hypothetical protein
LALLTLALDRSAYRAIALLGSLTGPAILLSLAGVFVSTLMDEVVSGGGRLAVNFLINYGLWPISVALIHGATRVLRGKGSFTQTFRALGFAQTVRLLELLRFIPLIEPLIAAAVSLLYILVASLAVAEAHKLRGWRTVLLPILFFVLLVLSSSWILILSGGLVYAIQTLGQQLGLLP